MIILGNHWLHFQTYIPQFIRAGQDRYRGKYIGVGTVFLDMVGMLLSQNLTSRLSGTPSSRIMVAAWLVFVFIIAVAYRGNLTASLTLPKYPSRPETLQEIVDTVDMYVYSALF